MTYDERDRCDVSIVYDNLGALFKQNRLGGLQNVFYNLGALYKQNGCGRLRSIPVAP